MAAGSKFSIYGAITANILIAISKFLASFFTGSAAMLAEGIHSLIDTGNGLLLLLGIKFSKKSADQLHPFGYGKEIYFWSFVVSILIFSLGGGFAIYEGIHALQNPEKIADPLWNYIVLGTSILFEGVSLIIAIKNFNKTHRSGSIVQNIIGSKDPASFAIIIEDSAAVTGLLIALLGVFLSERLDVPAIDGIASLLIGILLLLVASFLARETKGLLLGESAKPEIIKKIRTIIESQKEVIACDYPKTIHFGPEQILLTVKIDLEDHIQLMDAEKIIRELRKEIRTEIPAITQLHIETANHF